MKAVTSPRITLRQAQTVVAAQNGLHDFDRLQSLQSLQFNSSITFAMFDGVIIAGEVAIYFGPLWTYFEHTALLALFLLAMSKAHRPNPCQRQMRPFAMTRILKYIAFRWFSRSSEQLFFYFQRGPEVTVFRNVMISWKALISVLFALGTDSGRR